MLRYTEDEVTIVVFPRGRSDYEARINGNPKLWAAGRPSEAAVADVVRSHPEHVVGGYKVRVLGPESDESQMHRARVLVAGMFAPRKR